MGLLYIFAWDFSTNTFFTKNEINKQVVFKYIYQCESAGEGFSTSALKWTLRQRQSIFGT